MATHDGSRVTFVTDLKRRQTRVFIFDEGGQAPAACGVESRKNECTATVLVHGEQFLKGKEETLKCLQKLFEIAFMGNRRYSKNAQVTRAPITTEQEWQFLAFK